MITKYNYLKSLFARLVRDEQGGELVEWVLVCGLMVVICLVAMKNFGFSLAAWWNDAVAAM